MRRHPPERVSAVAELVMVRRPVVRVVRDDRVVLEVSVGDGVRVRPVAWKVEELLLKLPGNCCMDWVQKYGIGFKGKGKGMIRKK